MPDLVDVLVPMRVLRARKGRVTGWIVQCGEHGATTPVMHSKARAVEQAQLHGTHEHQGAVRITVPK